MTSTASADRPARGRDERLRVARPRDRGWAVGLALIAPAFLLMVLLIFAPATLSVIGTFFPNGRDGPSLANYDHFFADRLQSLPRVRVPDQILFLRVGFEFSIGHGLGEGVA